MAGATMNITPYHYCYSNPINFIDPSGMYAYDWDTGEYKNKNGDVVSWNEVQSNNYKEPVSFDMWGGLKNAWDSFWGISAMRTITGGNATPEEMSVAQDQLEASLVKMEKAEETIETVNMVLITSATVLTGYGVAAEGGIVVSRLYAVGADIAQQRLLKGDFSEVDLANAIISGLGVKGAKGVWGKLANNKALLEFAKTMIDWQPGGPLEIKTNFIDISSEYMLRIGLGPMDKGVKDPGLKYTIQLVKKGVRGHIQPKMTEALKNN